MPYKKVESGKINLLKCNRAVAVYLCSDGALGYILVQVMMAASFLQAQTRRWSVRKLSILETSFFAGKTWTALEKTVGSRDASTHLT